MFLLTIFFVDFLYADNLFYQNGNPWKKNNGCLLLPENGFNFRKVRFCFQNRFPRPKIDPHVNFNNFQAAENFFHFQNFETF